MEVLVKLFFLNCLHEVKQRPQADFDSITRFSTTLLLIIDYPAMFAVMVSSCASQMLG